MVFSASQMAAEEGKNRTKSKEERILRKSNSPTIEDDFTIDLEEEEPFDEPRSTPKGGKNVTFDTKNDQVDLDIEELCWTGSDLDANSERKEDRTLDQRDDAADNDQSKSTRSIVWSESELEDSVDQRDDRGVEARDNVESREGVQQQSNAADDSMHAVWMTEKNSVRQGARASIQEKGQPSKSGVQFRVQTKARTSTGNSRDPYENVGIRSERSTDSAMAEDAGDENSAYESAFESAFGSAFSTTPSNAPSVALSVTKRTRNTRGSNKSPRTPRTPRRPNFDDNASTAKGGTSVMTANIETGGTCSMLMAKPCGTTVINEAGEEQDLLDRFFETMEGKVCKSPSHKSAKESEDDEEDGLKRLIINPFLDHLEKFDTVFEQLEELACPEDGKKKGEGGRSTTPSAFAAAKFTQLLDQIEKFDPGCQTSCNIYEDGGDVDDDNSKEGDEDEDRSQFSMRSTPYDALEKAYQRAEKMVKDQKRTSFDKKDQIQKMKEQWFAARLNWKLRQSILVEAVRQNSAKAAKTTSKYVDTMVATCQASLSSADKNVEQDDNTKNTKDATPGYDSERDAGNDAASIDNSDFFSILSPSEHSNIHSSRRNFRSTVPEISSEDETSAFMSHSEHVLRSPQCFSPSYSEGPGHVEGKENASAIGVSIGPLAAITEEVSGVESNTSENASKRNDPNKEDSNSSEVPSNPNEWLEKWKSTVASVYTVSERILDRAQCTSAAINFADSNSFEDDNEMSDEVRKQKNSIIEDEEYSVSVMAETEQRDEIGAVRDNSRSSSSRRMKQKNLIIEDEEYSVSVMTEIEQRDDNDEDDMSGFETAVNTMDTEQDERPPMLRLMKSRTDSRSCGSRAGSRDGSRDGVYPINSKSKSNSGSVHSRLSSELPDGYTLADSIRHASMSSQNKGANRTRASQEPRGNKIKTDPSTHARRNNLPPAALPRPPKLDPDSKSKDQEKIKSPRSSETNETSDMTEVPSSSSDVMVTQVADSTHSKRSVVIDMETPEDKKKVEDDEKTMVSAKDGTTDGTVFSYNTTSTGSTEFKDCYQDAIPSLSTMGTARDDESLFSLARGKIAKRGNALKLPSNENIVKSMALLSVSAAVLKTAGNKSSQIDSQQHEVESVPSASSYSQEDAVADSIVEKEGNNAGQKVSEQNEVATDCPQEDIVEDFLIGVGVSKILSPKKSLPILFEEDKNDSHLEGESTPSASSCNREDIIEDLLIESSKKLESKEAPPILPEDDGMVEGGFEEKTTENPMVGFDEKSNHENTAEDVDEAEPLPTVYEESIAKDTCLENGPGKEDETFNSDELVLQSLKGQESVEKPDSLEEEPSIDYVTDEIPKNEGFSEVAMPIQQPKLNGSMEDDDDTVEPTLATMKVLAKLREERSVEDRRRRRLRQRRKFEKVLLGEDDSSSLSSSTMSNSSHHNENVPLISASFDTGFGSTPVVEESS